VPLYEYQCDKCAHRFEVIQKFSDAPIEVCPKCGGPVVKLLSSPAIQFKGSGWYITDYARKSDGGSAGTASSEAKADAKSDAARSGSKAEPKADAKADAKSETKSESKGTS
jgi:putative FmdB family regulatory protein